MIARKSALFYILVFSCATTLNLIPIPHGSTFAKSNDTQKINAVLISAEAIFVAMKDKNYPKIWECLTEKSRKRIVDDIYEANQRLKTGEKVTIEQITDNFNKCGTICKEYWDAFLFNFNPEIVLNESRWDIGFIENDRAEILIKYKKSENPAILKMYKENGKWRFGLVESFWTRK